MRPSAHIFLRAMLSPTQTRYRISSVHARSRAWHAMHQFVMCMIFPLHTLMLYSHLHIYILQEVVMVLIANGRKVEEGPMNAIPSVSRPSCDSKRGFDSETSPKSAGHDELDEGIQKHSKIRKLWLHTAVYPAPGGGSNGHICRYCGTLLVSQNVSVRKKVRG